VPVETRRHAAERAHLENHLALSPESIRQLPEAMLSQWLVARVDFDVHSEFVLCGLVYGHRHLEDGQPVVTSAILEFADDGSWARTVNTLYRLHEPSQSRDADGDWKLRVLLFATKRLVGSVTLQGIEVRADWPFVRSPAEKFKPRVN
jgi:hypothetical protein